MLIWTAFSVFLYRRHPFKPICALNVFEESSRVWNFNEQQIAFVKSIEGIIKNS